MESHSKYCGFLMSLVIISAGIEISVFYNVMYRTWLLVHWIIEWKKKFIRASRIIICASIMGNSW